MTVVAYYGISRWKPWAARPWGAIYYLALIPAWTYAISQVSDPGDTAITVVCGSLLFLFLVWRYRRRSKKQWERMMSAASLMNSWQAYADDCAREGKTPLSFEDWQAKGKAWIRYMQQATVLGSDSVLDFNEWRAAGEPAE